MPHRFERERSELDRVERRYPGVGHAFRMRQRVQHRQFHARHAHLGEDAAIDELDERVHHTLRVDDDLDPIVGQAEQEMRLDHLECLVRERRAVDGDLPAHRPRRMLQRRVDRRALEPVARPCAERATRRGQDESPHLRSVAPSDALQDGRVLAVDRNDLAAPLPGSVVRELPGYDERLLVRECDPLPGVQRGERRIEPRRADDGVQHDRRIVTRRGLHEALSTVAPAARRRRRVARHEPDETRPELFGLRVEQRRVPVRGERGDAKA